MYLNTNKVINNTPLQREYNWEFILPILINSSIDNTAVSTFIQEVKFGQYNFTDLTSRRHGPFTSKSAGFMDIDNVTLTILSPSNALVTQYFKTWREMIVHPDGYYFPKANYAFASYVYLYDQKQNHVGGYKLINTFPKTFPEYNLTYSGDGLVKHRIELSVDQIERIN